MNIHFYVPKILNPNDESILGFIEATTLLSEEEPVIIKKIVDETIPDAYGNSVLLKRITILRPNRYPNSIVVKNNKYSICTEPSDWCTLPFFQVTPKEITNKFLRFNSDKGAYHPEFIFRPIFKYNFGDAYDGLDLDRIIDYLDFTRTSCYEKSFTAGIGKDDKFVVYQKIDFIPPPNQYFFSDLLQIFGIFWFDEENDYHGLASEMGSGFYRHLGTTSAYSSQFSWIQINDNRKIFDILEWYKNSQSE